MVSTLLDVGPPGPEPLPLYSRQDPETASIRSAAPSYVSDTPTYISYRTPTSLLPPLEPGQESVGLPAPRVYAPGFAPELRNRSLASRSQYNLHIGANAKTYDAIARRRARADAEAILTSASASSLERPTTSTASSPASSSASMPAYPVQVAPMRPLDSDARRLESGSWEAMAGTGSWERRRRSSWNLFRGGTTTATGKGRKRLSRRLFSR